jgi:hypothetical protein
MHPGDGRIAQLLYLHGGNTGQSGERWVCVTAPNGQLTIKLLEDHDVADWTPITGSEP